MYNNTLKINNTNQKFAFSFLCFSIWLNFAMYLTETSFRYYSSVSLYVNIIALVLNLVISQKISIPNNLLKLITLNIIYALFTLTINNSGVGWIVNLLLFFLMLILVNSFNGLKGIPIWIFAIDILLLIYYCYRSRGYYLFYFSNIGNSINSNTVGFLIFLTGSYAVLFAELKNKHIPIILKIILYAVTLWAVYETRSRGALLGVAFFAIFNIVSSKFQVFRKHKSLVLIYWAIIFAGIAVPRIYMYLYESGMAARFAISGKVAYSGREEIWKNFFSNVNLFDWIKGYGSNATFYTGNNLNMHNLYLALVVNYGLIGLFGFFSIFKNVLFRKNSEEYNGGELTYISFILSVLIVCYFEVTLLWSPMMMLILFPLCFIGDNNDG